MLTFEKATKEKSKLRLALYGPPGSGKTYTALALATHLDGVKKIAVVDTEHGRASKYADLFAFDVLELASFEPQLYVEAIGAAQKAGYDLLIIDSLSHAWSGTGGLLEQVDEFAKKSPSQNTFVAWKQGTPIQNRMIEAINACDMHIICTLRSKVAYVMEVDDRGKNSPKRVGLEPIQRDGVEYEYDLTGQMNPAHELIIEKSTCPALVDKVIPKPGAETAKIISDWLSAGTKPTAHAKATYDPEPAPVVTPACVECGVIINDPRTVAAGVKKFGRVLCVPCGKAELDKQKAAADDSYQEIEHEAGADR